jgi:predicted nucleic acid-binding Zn ribbon protein
MPGRDGRRTGRGMTAPDFFFLALALLLVLVVLQKA